MQQYKLKSIQSDIKITLQKSLSNNNIRVENITLKEDDNGLIKINVQASEIIDGLTLGERLYIENAQEYNCNPLWIYQRTNLSGESYEIISWNQNSYRYPITVKEVYSSEIKKITTKKLISLFNKGYLIKRKFNNPYFR
jgi:hypothetical protein